MPGLTLGIGETNPKKGAVQYDARRIDGVPFVIPSGAGVTEAPIGSIVTLQEFASIGQKIVLGAAAYTDPSSNVYTIIGIGFLEAATQSSGEINQTVAEYSDGDIASMISDVAVVAAVPMDASGNPVAGINAFIDAAGRLSNSDYGTVRFPGAVFFTTPGQQVTNQLKSGYCYARLTDVILLDAFITEVTA
jgi:hypothetical protein